MPASHPPRVRSLILAFGVGLALGSAAATAAVSPLVTSLRLSQDIYRPGQVPTLCFTSTGSQFRQPGFVGANVDAFLSFSPSTGATSTSPFPPFFIGSISNAGMIELQLAAVTCSTEDRYIQGMAVDPVTHQMTEITNEVLLTVDRSSCDPNDPVGGEGCGAGFWKQANNLQLWPIPIRPGIRFRDVFEDAFPGKTLGQVLTGGGGPLNSLGRQTVAALLNAESGALDSDLTTPQVIEMFNQAFPGTSAEYSALAETLRAFNEQACGLGG